MIFPYICFMKSSSVRNQIIETASKLFYTQGYNSTGINQIIKEAEVAKASLYQHFPSKEDLLIEYLNIKAIDTNKILQSVLDKHKTPKAKVLSMFDFLLKYAEQTEFQGCNFLNIASEIPKENDKVKALIKKQKNHIRNLFAQALKPLGKEKMADEMYVLFDGALISSKVYGDVWPIQTTKKIVEKLL